MRSICVRAMTAADIAPVVRWMVHIPLFRRYRLTADKARAQFQWASERGDVLLVADREAEDQACGFAWCMVGGAFGRSGYLRLIGVRPDCAGSGVGAALLAEVERIAAEHGDDLLLLVSDFNGDAQRFYRRHGYRQIGAIPGYVLPDVTELILWKHLRP